MTTEYHKINAPFKRDMSAKTKPLIMGDWALPELEYLANNQFEFTEKVDGTNIRIELTRVEDLIFVDYKGRTDNADIPMPLLLHLEKTFPKASEFRRDLSMPSYFERYFTVVGWMVDNSLDAVVLYGEGYGPKINGGGKYRDDPSFVLFDVKIGDWWLDRSNVNDVASKLGIDSVPVLGTGTLWDAIDMVRTDNFRQGLKSEWGDFEAEGIVARPVVPLFDRKGHRIITKIKGRDFK